MRVLFDQGTPAPLRRLLATHSVDTAYELGWAIMKNGELIQAAESAGYDVLVTTDTNLKYQQNLRDRKIAIIVLSTTSWPRIRSCSSLVVDAIDHVGLGSYLEVFIP